MKARSKSKISPLTIEAMLARLRPKCAPSAMPDWPPDAFCICAYLLKHSGAYVRVLEKWPPGGGDIDVWTESIRASGKAWRNALIDDSPLPPEILNWWGEIVARLSTQVKEIEKDRTLLVALISLVSAADEGCYGIGILGTTGRFDDLDDVAFSYLDSRSSGHSSLCESIDPNMAMVLPKLHNPLSGITLRSLTHNLALWDRVEVRPIWYQLTRELGHGVNVLILPWPLQTTPNAFRSVPPAPGTISDDFGLFSVDIASLPTIDSDVEDALRKATALVGRIDAVIFPELSMELSTFRRLRTLLKGVLVIAGVGSAGTPTFGTNSVMIGFEDGSLTAEFSQNKHHRWRLDPSQVSQYGLGSAIDTQKKWSWESINIGERVVTFITVNEWLTFCALICEDLARQDPVAELVRTVGPNLVIGLLMDGPQLNKRWSSRYATVLADDPRCSVLTLTNAGLVDQNRAQGFGGKRSVALWKDALSGDAQEIVLEENASGVILSLGREWATEWTADGRSDEDSTAYLRLRGLHQVN